jgi:hypothetical protein
MDHGDSGRVDPAVNEHSGHRLGDGDDSIGTSPEAFASEWEINPAGDDERGSGKQRAHPGEAQGMGVMGMEKSRLTAELPENCRQDARVNSCAPGRRSYRNP